MGAMSYAIKAAIDVPGAGALVLPAQKTMYGGKNIARGDTIYLFASENGLAARGVVTEAAAVPRKPGVARQTPLVDLRIEVAALATRPLGRPELRRFDAWTDGGPETELNFKLYRQATNKVVGISDAAAAFLAGLFEAE